MKAGQVVTVSVNLDAITNPDTIIKRKIPGATMMLINGSTTESAMCFNAQQWGSGREGNHNAKWRRRMARRKSAK